MSQEHAAAAADSKALVCTFCRTNDPRVHVYTGHTVKDSRGSHLPSAEKVHLSTVSDPDNVKRDITYY